MEGIMANGVHSYRDLGFCIAERRIGFPQKEIKKQKIPYMHGAYNFGKMAGEEIYGERTLEYVFEIAEFTTREMEQQKDMIANWLACIFETEITDDFDPDYKFFGSLEKMDWDENFGEGSLKASFTVYPFRIARAVTRKTIIGIGNIVNTSVHPVYPILNAPANVTIKVNGNNYAYGSGTTEVEEFVLNVGENIIEVLTGGSVELSYVEERV